MTIPLPDRVAARAQFIVDNAQQTDYQHHEHIDTETGVYDCDCSGFVGFVLHDVAPRHYAVLPREAAQPRPRAFEYHDFFASSDPQPDKGWARVDLLRDARRGDVIAWRFPEVRPGHDTGHVLIVADTPHPDERGGYTLGGYDSATRPHFDDTRGDGPGRFPDGVGHGRLAFEVDTAGRPTGFLFSPTDPRFHTLPISIGRLSTPPEA